MDHAAGADAPAQATAAVCIGGEHQRVGCWEMSRCRQGCSWGWTAPVRGILRQAVMTLSPTGFLSMCQAVLAVYWSPPPGVKGFRQVVYTLVHL